MENLFTTLSVYCKNCLHLPFVIFIMAHTKKSIFFILYVINSLLLYRILVQ